MEYIGERAGAYAANYMSGGNMYANQIGARIGREVGAQLSRRMSKSTPSTPPATPRRRLSFSQTGLKRAREAAGVSKRTRRADMKAYQKTKSVKAANTESGTSMRAAKVVNRRKKSVSFRKKRKVTISRKFKAKVAKALSPHQATGKYTEIGYQSVHHPTTLGNQQQVARLGIDANSAQLGLNSQILFSPAMILNAASVMFNGKTATRNAQYTLDGSNRYEFGTNSFDARTSKITLKNSYAQFTLRNNTNRTWIIQLYECAPKARMVNPGENDCLQQWSNSMLNESQVQGAGPATINLASATPNTLYATPLRNKMLMQKWNIERHEIILDPGQVYDHYVQGPSDTVYDYAKFWKADQSGTADLFYDFQKGLTRQVFMTSRLDITNDVSRETARHGIADADAKSGRLSVEYKNYYNILSPPQTGGTGTNNPATNVTVHTNERIRDCYFHKNWFADSDPADIRMSRETEADNS